MLDYVNLNFDSDGDGVLDSFAQGADLNGDGIEEALLVDLDADGTTDILAMDTDGDKIMETVAVDTDGNGVFDMFQSDVDADYDGRVDQTTKFHDYNQDGQLDSGSVYADTDGDGKFDLVSKMRDTDSDGMMDEINSSLDTDGDGAADMSVQELLLDMDGDDIPDTYIVQADHNADQVFDAVGIFDYDPWNGTVELIEQAELGESDSLAWLNFDPAESDPEKVCGDPASSMEQWEYQGDTGRCALYSQKFIIEELTGKDIDIEEMADFAEENHWFSEENGTPLLHMNKMLNAYGIENEMSFHNGTDDIRHCLENGGKVIVSIDADEIWYGETDEMFVPVDGANHAVQVIGIDDSDPSNPMVILNDSGTPDGCGEMIPLDVFEDAWADGDCQMIACY